MAFFIPSAKFVASISPDIAASITPTVLREVRRVSGNSLLTKAEAAGALRQYFDAQFTMPNATRNGFRLIFSNGRSVRNFVKKKIAHFAADPAAAEGRLNELKRSVDHTDAIKNDMVLGRAMDGFPSVYTSEEWYAFYNSGELPVGMMPSSLEKLLRGNMALNTSED